MSDLKNATIVVIHGAWADGSSWEPVIRKLQGEGLNVVAAPIPLTSLGEDAAALRRTIARTQGPVIVVGHAYAGAVVGRRLSMSRPSVRTREKRLRMFSTETNLIPTHLSSLPMQTALSGCPMRASRRPSHRMQHLSRSHCAAQSSGRFR